MGILLKEHSSKRLEIIDDPELFKTNTNKYLFQNTDQDLIIKPRKFKTERGIDSYCFICEISDKTVELRSNYFVGIDWLTKDRFIHVDSKLNHGIIDSYEIATSIDKESISGEEIHSIQKEAEINIKNGINYEIDIIAMLLEVTSNADIVKFTHNLFIIDWDAPEIPITQKQDLLTPFLIVTFLKLLKVIVKKGLKKSYYKVTENLNNRVKGKVLVSQQVKQNIFKNRFTQTVCEYQVFGEDSAENRFLKKVFQFCSRYAENNTRFFKDTNKISATIKYITPSFERISLSKDYDEIKHFKHSLFFLEYKEAVKIGQYILRTFSYNITKTTEQKVSTPPFWIDMPKMFELYVFARLLNDNCGLTAANLNYQFSTYGNSLDFLICNAQGNIKIVLDTKYKLKYNYGKIHDDIRQVAGYARLNKVKLQIPCLKEEIPCLIIYPKLVEEVGKVNLHVDQLLNFKINAYHKVYKLGIDLPLI